MTRIYVDFETYWNTKENYCIKSKQHPKGLPMALYIRDPRFKAFGCGVMTEEGAFTWLNHDDLLKLQPEDWTDIELVAHNVKFDGAILAWRYGIRPARYFDTQSLSRAVLGQSVASYSLKVVSEYLSLPPKGELKTDGLSSLSQEQEKEMIAYNRRDLECCRGIDKKLRPQFPSSQEASLNWTIRAFTDPILTLDVERLEKMVTAKRDDNAAIFERLGLPREVFASSDKFKKLLEDRHVEVPTKISPTSLKRGGPPKYIPAFSLTDPGFIALKEVVPDLCEGRIAAKSTIVEKRGSSLADVGRSGAFPFDVQFSGAIGTHRYSGGSGGGGNPQNLLTKGDMRASVLAPDGYCLVVGDFAAIEAREVAWLAKEPKLVTGFLNNEDIYSDFASGVYKHKVTKKEQPTERAVGKTCILGLGYGMGDEKLQFTVGQPPPRGANVKLPLEQCTELVKFYRGKYWNIPILWDNAEALIPQMIDGHCSFVPFAPFLKTAKNALILPSGLRIQYPNLRQGKRRNPSSGRVQDAWLYDNLQEKSHEIVEEKLYGGKVVENICQALAGEICKIAIERAEEAGLRVVGQVHDEILVVAPTSADEYATRTLKACMEQSVPFWPAIRLAAEVKTGRSWADAKGA